MVALNFTANGGDGYPIKYLDPAATPPNQIANPETGNFRYVLTGGGLSAEVPRNLDFAEASVIPAGSLGEQKAFGDYLTMRHGTRTLAYNAADTPVAEDQRIQQLPVRSLDTVRFTPVELWRQEYFGNPDGSGNEGNAGDADGDSVNNLFEFAFGTNPSSAVSGTGELSYLGTFAGNGSIGSTGQPVTGVEQVPNSVDFRFVFIRRKDYQAAGLIYTPQFSADLETWRSSTAVPEILADDGTHQVVSVPYIRFINGRKAQFARLMVTMP
jgi:hypothetical protein